MTFAPEYLRSVLTENFEDAKARFLSPLVTIQRAHLVMLADRGIVSAGDARAIRDAIQSIPLDAVRSAAYDGSCEDLYFYVQRLLAGQCGEAAAGRLGAAASRNDLDMTMYRMRLREGLAGLAGALHRLRRALIDVADRHRETLVAAHTHTQPAQPTTIAHYLLAVIEQLERDDGRLRAAYQTTNRCPLGACAITGTGFPIDRALTASLLGFDGPTGNTYGSIAAADYLLESVGAAQVSAVGLGRVVQDLLLWSTPEFDYLRLPDGFVQASSIMPQKRNPVAFEHARAILSRAIGQAAAVTAAVHNTPFGDVVDTEDDLQPLVFATFRDATRAVDLLAASLAHVAVNVARLESQAGARGTTLTELADSLTRERGVPFRTAYAVAARLGAILQERPSMPLSQALVEASAGLVEPVPRYTDSELARRLDARYFVNLRETPGGPAPAEIARALARARESLDTDDTWWREREAVLADAARRLDARSAAL
jgi:argininosuccinate lyase